MNVPDPGTGTSPEANLAARMMAEMLAPASSTDLDDAAGGVTDAGRQATQLLHAQQLLVTGRAEEMAMVHPTIASRMSSFDIDDPVADPADHDLTDGVAPGIDDTFMTRAISTLDQLNGAQRTDHSISASEPMWAALATIIDAVTTADRDPGSGYELVAQCDAAITAETEATTQAAVDFQLAQVALGNVATLLAYEADDLATATSWARRCHTLLSAAHPTDPAERHLCDVLRVACASNDTALGLRSTPHRAPGGLPAPQGLVEQFVSQGLQMLLESQFASATKPTNRTTLRWGDTASFWVPLATASHLARRRGDITASERATRAFAQATLVDLHQTPHAERARATGELSAAIITLHRSNVSRREALSAMASVRRQGPLEAAARAVGTVTTDLRRLLSSAHVGPQAPGAPEPGPDSTHAVRRRSRRSRILAASEFVRAGAALVDDDAPLWREVLDCVDTLTDGSGPLGSDLAIVESLLRLLGSLAAQSPPAAHMATRAWATCSSLLTQPTASPPGRPGEPMPAQSSNPLLIQSVAALVTKLPAEHMDSPHWWADLALAASGDMVAVAVAVYKSLSQSGPQWVHGPLRDRVAQDPDLLSAGMLADWGGPDVEQVDVAALNEVVSSAMTKLRRTALEGRYTFGGVDALAVAAKLATQHTWAYELWKPAIEVLREPQVASADKELMLQVLIPRISQLPPERLNDLVNLDLRHAPSAIEGAFDDSQGRYRGLLLATIWAARNASGRPVDDLEQRLFELMTDQVPARRAIAARVLGIDAKNTAKVPPALVALAGDRDGTVRATAASEIVELALQAGEVSPPAVEALNAALVDTAEPPVTAVVGTLSEHAPIAPSVIAPLRAALTHLVHQSPSRWVRSRASSLLDPTPD